MRRFEAAVRRASAPVKAPRSWPNSSDSISDAGMAAQSKTTKRLCARGELQVDRLGEALLAGAALALEQDR